MLESSEFLFQRNRKLKSSIVSCLVSLISVIVTQFTLSLLPLILPASSFLALLPLSAVLLIIVVGLGRFCKSVVGVRASAPAFVLFSILFIWTLYFSVVRQVTSSLVSIVFNTEIIMVIAGLCRIMLSDPGFVTHHSSCHDLLAQNPLSKVEIVREEMEISTSIVRQEYPGSKEIFTGHRRAKYCRHCKHYVMGFDHHCPAFGNCIGRRNHVLFIVVLIGFVASEATFAACASHFTAKSETLSEVGRKATFFQNLVLSTMLFCLVQVLWQINWEKYPEFRIEVDPLADLAGTGTRFMNPYDKGILKNLKEFLTAKG